MAEKIFERYELEVDLEKADHTAIIETHGVPVHADDVFSIEMIRREADTGWVEKNRREDGIIELDVPGSRFSDKKNSVKKESTSVKVARSLGLLDDPKWLKLVDYVNGEDLKGSSNKKDILTLLKRGQQQNPPKAEEICNWFLEGIIVKVEFDHGNKDFGLERIFRLMQENEHLLDFDPMAWKEKGEQIINLHQRYFRLAQAEIMQKRSRGQLLEKTITLFDQNKKSRQIRLAAVKSINYRMQAALRSGYRDYQPSQIVIVKQPGGVLVTIDAKYDKLIDMREIAAALRYFEAKSMGQKNGTPDWKGLRKAGTSEIARAWYLNVLYSPIIIQNSLSHNAPPTNLSLRQLFKAVSIALDEKSFHPNTTISNHCRNGICRLGGRCPNFQIGLARCVDAYFNTLRHTK